MADHTNIYEQSTTGYPPTATPLLYGSSEEFVGGCGCHRNQLDLRSGSTEGFRPSRLCPRISPERQGEGLMRGRRADARATAEGLGELIVDVEWTNSAR